MFIRLPITLLLQDYPDIKPEKYQIEEGVSEETVLIKTIFLIKNEAELPPEPEED